MYNKSNPEKNPLSDPSEAESLAFAFKQIRESLELTQTQFGELLGCSESTVKRWEANKTVPTFTVSQVKKLKEVLKRVGMDIDDLPDEKK